MWDPLSIGDFEFLKNHTGGNQDFFVKLYVVANIGVLSIERGVNLLHTMVLRDWKGGPWSPELLMEPKLEEGPDLKGGTSDSCSYHVKKYGISGQISCLISSFLSNRHFRVVLNGKNPFLSQRFPYYTLVTILMMLSVILLSICWWYSSLI